MTLTPTQARCLRAMVAWPLLVGPGIATPRATAEALIAAGLARYTGRTDYHSIIEPTEAGRAEARRLEEEKTT